MWQHDQPIPVESPVEQPSELELGEVDRARSDGVRVELVEAWVVEVVVGEPAAVAGSRRGVHPIALAVVVEDGQIGPHGTGVEWPLDRHLNRVRRRPRVLRDDLQGHPLTAEGEPIAQGRDLTLLGLHPPTPTADARRTS